MCAYEIDSRAYETHGKLKGNIGIPTASYGKRYRFLARIVETGCFFARQNVGRFGGRVRFF